MFVGQKIGFRAGFLELRHNSKGFQVAKLNLQGQLCYCVALNRNGIYRFDGMKGKRLEMSATKLEEVVCKYFPSNAATSLTSFASYSAPNKTEDELLVDLLRQRQSAYREMDVFRFDIFSFGLRSIEYECRRWQQWLADFRELFVAAKRDQQAAAEFIRQQFNLVVVEPSKDDSTLSLKVRGQTETQLVNVLLRCHRQLICQLVTETSRRAVVVEAHGATSSRNTFVFVESDSEQESRFGHKQLLVDGKYVELPTPWWGRQASMADLSDRQTWSTRTYSMFDDCTALCDGGAVVRQILGNPLIEIAVGETKSYVLATGGRESFFLNPSSSRMTLPVWGVTATRTDEGLQLSPYDNGRRYFHWDGQYYSRAATSAELEKQQQKTEMK